MPLEEIEVLYVGDMGWDHPIKEGKLWIRSIEADPESDPPFSALEQLVLDSTNPETATHIITEVLTRMRDVSEEDQDEEVGDKDGDGCSEQAMFPLLKIIVLRHLDVDPTSTTLGKKLLRALKTRNKHSKPIDKLCIESEFEVTDECLERFGKLVGEVEYTEIPEEVEREPDWLTQMKAW
ncbi:hypothetical protein C8Q75DRAFT_804521 [Abortiporus biennis]|nr:hypothetical protein C8Q75DRAFT_804521 [Abortiporus biennis]